MEIKSARHTFIRAFALSAMLALLCACGSSADKESLAETRVVVLRHAEKMLDSSDPGLTDAGMQRAVALAERLRDADLAAVVVSEAKRAQLSGQPAADVHGLALEVRPAAGVDASAYARELKTWIEKNHRGRTVLVVGHSNTVPSIVATLAGAAVDPMGDSEYDRYSVVHLPSSGAAWVEVSRY